MTSFDVFARYKKLQKQCGTYATAKHLKNQGYSLTAALYILTKSKYGCII